MKNQLEDFIRANKTDFDIQEAPKSIWNNIQRVLFESSKTAHLLRYWQAAAILFFSLFIWLFVQFKVQDYAQSESSEFKEAVSFYSSQIDEKFRQVNNQEANDLYLEDLKNLEVMYALLKEELKQRPSVSVKDAMILNLMLRDSLLNRQLQAIEKAKEDHSSKTTNL